MIDTKEEFTITVPSTICDASDDVFNEFYSLMIAIINTYKSFIKRGISKEDARRVLPNCINAPEENEQEARG